MGPHRAPPDPTRPGRRRSGPVPATTGGRALAACRERLHAAVALLAEANTTLRGTVAARDRALLELQAAERAQDAFVVAAVHELKTPLTAVKGRAQLLQRRARGVPELDAAQLAAGLVAIEAAADMLGVALDALIAEVERPLPAPGDDGRGR